MGCSSSTAAAGGSSCASGPRFHDKYALGEVLGGGRFGHVKSATSLDGRPPSADTAAKILDLRRSSYASEADDNGCTEKRRVAESEAMLWRCASGHPNVVQLREVFFEENACYLVMDRCAGTVAEKLERDGPLINAADIRSVFREILLGLAHVHSAGVAHRDLKPENVLLTDSALSWCSRPQLCDFGLSASLPDHPGGRLFQIVGSPPYMSPEMLDNKSGYDERTDVWSFGVTAYLMLFGELPYRPRDTASSAAMHEMISAGFPRPEFQPSRVCFAARMPCDSAVAFVRALLTRPFGRRPFATGGLELPLVAGALELPLVPLVRENATRMMSPDDFVVAAEPLSPGVFLPSVAVEPVKGDGVSKHQSPADPGDSPQRSPAPNDTASIASCGGSGSRRSSEVSTRPPWSSVASVASGATARAAPEAELHTHAAPRGFGGDHTDLHTHMPTEALPQMLGSPLVAV